MEIKVLIYLLIGAIYIVSRLIKNKAAQPGQDTSPQERKVEPRQSQAKPEKGMTFEELLKEITEAKQQPKQTQPVRPTTEYVNYDEEVKDEEEDLEVVEETKVEGRLYQEYEEGKRQAFNRPSLEETLSLQNTVVEFGKFRSFSQEEKRDLLSEYTRDLHDPEGLKKAFVLSEILNRRF